VFIKICGTTSEEDALLAVAMDADAIGFVFAPSPRQISPTIARDIAKRLPPEVMTVGVFRNEAPRRVVDIMQFAGLECAQLHGHERPEQARWIRKRLPRVFQAFAAGDPAVTRAREYGVDAVLLDNPAPGSGQVFDWALASEVPTGIKLMIAGGLTPQNVSGGRRRGEWRGKGAGCQGPGQASGLCGRRPGSRGRPLPGHQRGPV
jgi:phosphoribosylanthranilate isomerase